MAAQRPGLTQALGGMRKDWLGVFIAAVFVVGGLGLIVFPQKEMTVYHAGSSRNSTPRGFLVPDRITPLRSYIYGGSILLVGVAVGVLSLYSPRRKN